MAGPRTTFNKRQKEMARLQKQKDKAERKKLRAENPTNSFEIGSNDDMVPQMDPLEDENDESENK